MVLCQGHCFRFISNDICFFGTSIECTLHENGFQYILLALTAINGERGIPANVSPADTNESTSLTSVQKATALVDMQISFSVAVRHNDDEMLLEFCKRADIYKRMCVQLKLAKDNAKTKLINDCCFSETP